MAKKDWSPRLSVQITEEQYKALQVLPHGSRKILFGIVIDDIVRLYKEHREKFLAAVYARASRLEDWSTLMKK